MLIYIIFQLKIQIAPDISFEERKDIADVCLRRHVDGIIASNTSVCRPSTLISANKYEPGALNIYNEL